MILEANVEVLTSLRVFYERLLEMKDFPLKQGCADDIFSFATQLNSMIQDTKMHISRTKLIVRIIADRKELVCIRLFSFCACLQEPRVSRLNILIDTTTPSKPDNRDDA